MNQLFLTFVAIVSVANGDSCFNISTQSILRRTVSQGPNLNERGVEDWITGVGGWWTQGQTLRLSVSIQYAQGPWEHSGDETLINFVTLPTQVLDARQARIIIHPLGINEVILINPYLEHGGIRVRAFSSLSDLERTGMKVKRINIFAVDLLCPNADL